jgi:cytochrome c553
MKHSLWLVALLMICGSASADVQKGAQLSASCAHCHGTDGNSSSGVYPSLADQTKEYLYRQIKAFKDGTRSDQQMSPMVGILSDEDMRHLADFYNFQTLVRKPVTTDPALVAKGKKLSEELACGSCHRPNFKGINEFPRLARQKKPYLVKQMQDYRAGTRTNDDGVMAPAAKNLTDEQINALAEYLSSL